jgi:hypothetical protein
LIRHKERAFALTPRICGCYFAAFRRAVGEAEEKMPVNVIHTFRVIAVLAPTIVAFASGCSSSSSGFGDAGVQSGSGATSGSSSSGSASGGASEAGISDAGSGAAAESGSPSAPGADASSSGSSSGASGGSGVDAGGGEGGDDSVCATQTTQVLCVNCCSSNHMSGYQTFANALVACGCATGGPCVTACMATVCADPTAAPDMTCLTCLNIMAQEAPDGGPGPCISQINDACNGDPDCEALGTCEGPCQMLP